MSKSLEDMTEVDWAVISTSRDIEALEQELVTKSRWLKERMEQVIDLVESRKSHELNSLGAVQGQGHEVDRLVIVIRTRQQHLETLKRLASQNQ